MSWKGFFPLSKGTPSTSATCLFISIAPKGLGGASRKSLKTIQASAEREAIRYALESTDYNKVQAAALLGIHRTLLYKK